MSRQTLTATLLAGVIVFLVLAAATLVPSAAPKISDLGYSTFCPFAPWSTLALLFFAGLSWAIRRHVDSQPV
jgi:biotin transporter BioY